MVRTRFAPSPTGYLHVGGLRTAAYAYALAKHTGGEFLLRIEDTDQKREIPGATQKIYDLLQVFGLKWDGQPVVQSKRVKDGVYQSVAETMVERGRAFYCQCEAKNAKKEGYSNVLRDPCRDKDLPNGAIKIKIPDNLSISYNDFVLDKDIIWDSSTIGDATLLKSDGFPTYHLAAMVDDKLMGTTHILRGHDWMPSTPIHLLVLKSIDYDREVKIGHLTDIQDTSGGKLSKRKGNASVDDFLNMGYLQEALFNFIILLGWAPKDNKELFTLEEFVRIFDVNGFQKSNPVFNTQKLDWFNGHYIRQKTDTELTHLVKPFVKSTISDTVIAQIVPLVKERLTKLSDFDELAQPFVVAPSHIDPDLFAPNASICLTSVLAVMETNDFADVDSLNSEFKKAIEKLGVKVGDYFMAMRVALTSRRSTPPITETALILGKSESISRIKKALDQLGQLD